MTAFAPLTFSLANDVACGFITDAGVNLPARHCREAGFGVQVLAARFVVNLSVL